MSEQSHCSPLVIPSAAAAASRALSNAEEVVEGSPNRPALLVGNFDRFHCILAYVVGATGTLGVGFFLKLSISIPIIGAITFCTLQYSRERRLEEEYAFKSAISISLDPYQKLVSGLIDQNSPDERKQFAGFILDAIQKVFTSPTERIFEPSKRRKLNSKNP